MAKAKNSASKSKKKPIEQYAKKSKQRANNPRPAPAALHRLPFLPVEAVPSYFQLVLHGWQRCNTLIL
jgi:hypothetical protein